MKTGGFEHAKQNFIEEEAAHIKDLLQLFEAHKKYIIMETRFKQFGYLVTRDGDTLKVYRQIEPIHSAKWTYRSVGAIHEPPAPSPARRGNS